MRSPRPTCPNARLRRSARSQVPQFLDAAKRDRFYALYAVAIGTEMRLGEIFGLQLPDIDLKGRAINVRSTLIEINGKLSLAEPKTPKSRRRVDLPRFVVEALTKHRAQLVREGFAKVPWVFCNANGGPLRRTHFHVKHFKPLLDAGGLPSSQVPHCDTRTFLPTILGHSSLNQRTNHHGGPAEGVIRHSSPERQRRSYLRS